MGEKWSYKLSISLYVINVQRVIFGIDWRDYASSNHKLKQDTTKCGWLYFYGNMEECIYLGQLLTVVTNSFFYCSRFLLGIKLLRYFQTHSQLVMSFFLQWNMKMNEHLTHLLNYTYLNYLFFPLRFQHGKAVIYIQQCRWG